MQKNKKNTKVKNKEINLNNTGDYYADLAMIESTNNQTKIGNGGYLGLYQLGEAALVDAGYYKKEPKEGQKKVEYNNDWSGTWTGKNGINNKEDFLNSREVQNIAIREYHNKIGTIYLKNYQQHEGQKINNIELTKSGLISCAHLVGQGKLKKFIDSKGVIDEKDGNGVPCSEYLKKFGGYDYDFSTDALQNQLSAQAATANQPVQNTSNPQAAPAQQPPQPQAQPAPAPAAQPEPQPAQNTQAAPVQQPPQPQAQPTPAAQPEPQPVQNAQVAPVQQPPQPQAQPAPAAQPEPQPAQNTQTRQPEQKPAANNDKIYEVKPNDNLGAIAANNSMTLEALLNIPGNEKFKANPDQIKLGEKVNIAAPEVKNEEQPPVQEAGTQQEQPKQAQQQQLPQKFTPPNTMDELKKMQEISNDLKCDELKRKVCSIGEAGANPDLNISALDPMTAKTKLDTATQQISDIEIKQIDNGINNITDNIVDCSKKDHLLGGGMCIPNNNLLSTASEENNMLSNSATGNNTLLTENLTTNVGENATTNVGTEVNMIGDFGNNTGGITFA